MGVRPSMVRISVSSPQKETGKLVGPDVPGPTVPPPTERRPGKTGRLTPKWARPTKDPTRSRESGPATRVAGNWFLLAGAAMGGARERKARTRAGCFSRKNWGPLLSTGWVFRAHYPRPSPPDYPASEGDQTCPTPQTDPESMVDAAQRASITGFQPFHRKGPASNHPGTGFSIIFRRCTGRFEISYRIKPRPKKKAEAAWRAEKYRAKAKRATNPSIPQGGGPLFPMPEGGGKTAGVERRPGPRPGTAHVSAFEWDVTNGTGFDGQSRPCPRARKRWFVLPRSERQGVLFFHQIPGG